MFNIRINIVLLNCVVCYLIAVADLTEQLYESVYNCKIQHCWFRCDAFTLDCIHMLLYVLSLVFSLSGVLCTLVFKDW